ncbi:MAG TPA: hypothetical protein VGV38_12320, partial [Pyrinomonadaceae bacterium]|nr:hypothetical protein [Pyrinomonadaceae bacterium]
MNFPKTEKPSLGGVGGLRRKAVSSAPSGWVKTGTLPGLGALPLVVRPDVDGVSLHAWMAADRQWVERLLLEHRALLFRGFGVRTPQEFERVIKATS